MTSKHKYIKQVKNVMIRAEVVRLISKLYEEAEQAIKEARNDSK